MKDSLARLCSSDNRFECIRQMLEESGIHPVIQRYPHGANLIYSFGYHPHFIFGAHFDSVSCTPGANDNGASAIELLYLAKKLHAEDFKGDLTLVWFDKEESLGRGRMVEMGSYHFAGTLNKAGVTPGMSIILDVCGRGDAFAISNSYRGTCSSFLEQRLEDQYPCYTINTPPSDNAAFSARGLDSALLVTLPEEDLISGSRAVWSTLHTQNDLPEDMEESTMGMVVEMLGDLAHTLDEYQ